MVLVLALRGVGGVGGAAGGTAQTQTQIMDVDMGGEDDDNDDEDIGGTSSDDDGTEMDVDPKKRPSGSKKKKRGKASDEFKAKVMQILDKNDFAEKRASKMSQDDFMQLLPDFNEHGIHFA